MWFSIHTMVQTSYTLATRSTLEQPNRGVQGSA